MAEIRFNIDDDLKGRADVLFKALGIGINDAIKLFINQSININGLPFRPHLEDQPYTPNSKTIEAFREVEEGEYTAGSLADFEKEINSLRSES